MIVADVLTVTFIIIGLLLSLPAFWLVTNALVPAHSERMVARYRDRPVVSFFTGLGVSVGLFLFSIALGSVPLGPVKLVAVLVGGAALGYGLMGAGALAAFLGSRMPSAIDRDQPWRATMRGGGALVLSFLIPLLGWFVLLPVAVISGAGVNTLAFFGGKKTAPVGPRDERDLQPAAHPHPEVKAEAPKPEPAAMAGAGKV